VQSLINKVLQSFISSIQGLGLLLNPLPFLRITLVLVLLLRVTALLALPRLISLAADWLSCAAA